MREKKKVIDVLLGEEGDFSLKQRIYNSLFFISALAVLILFVGDVVQGLDFSIYIASFLASVLLFSMYLISRKLKLYKLLIQIYNLILATALIYLWYNSGGLNGVALIILIPMIGVIPLFVTGINRIFGVFFLVSLGSALLWFEINNPDFVRTIIDNQTQLINKFITALLMSFSILGVVFLIMHGYNKQHQKVLALNHSKDKLLSIIAHDLRNPIGTLNQLTNLLLERHDEMDSKDRELYISSMVQSTEGTYNLLENLLMWARTQSGNLEIYKEKLKVFELIERSVKLLMESANQKSLKIIVDIEEDLFIYADRNMIDTIIRNLISNSIKFSEDGKEILISARQSEEGVQVSVKDNGVGMSKSVQANVFENEKAISTKGTNEENGTGFGVKLCKDFVRRNNGKMSVISEEGVGTEVIVVVPQWS